MKKKIINFQESEIKCCPLVLSCLKQMIDVFDKLKQQDWQSKPEYIREANSKLQNFYKMTEDYDDDLS